MTRARPFRFGVFGENARSRGALLETVRRAEDSAYSTFLLRDHFIEEPFGHQLATLTALDGGWRHEGAAGREPRSLERLPASGDAREGDRDARRAVERTRRAGARSRLLEGRI